MVQAEHLESVHTSSVLKPITSLPMSLRVYLIIWLTDALVVQRPIYPSYQELIDFLIRLGSWVSSIRKMENSQCLTGLSVWYNDF